MIQSKMKVIVVEAAQKAAVREMSVPVPAEGEVLVRIHKALVCTWEQRIFAGADMTLPFVPGHEVSGTVAAIPENTFTDLAVGDRVVVKTYDSCGACEQCYRGHDNLCKGKTKQRTYDGIPGAGGFAQYMAISATRVYKLPNQAVSLEAAAFAEPLACCVHSLEQAGIELGEDVVVVGGGIMGQLHCLLAKLRGARVTLVEPDAGRRDAAAAGGANLVIDPTAENATEKIRAHTGKGAHVVFFTANSLQLAQDYIHALAPKGRLVYYGSFHPKGDIAMNPNEVHYAEWTLTGAYSPTVKSFWTSARLLSLGLLDPASFITERYPMEECQTALQRASSAETFRVLIDLE